MTCLQVKVIDGYSPGWLLWSMLIMLVGFVPLKSFPVADLDQLLGTKFRTFSPSPRATVGAEKHGLDVDTP